jgi:transcriptional regulator with XRE-family HTH domain
MKKRRSTPKICESFGYAVKLRREELGLTQEDLAEKAAIHRTYCRLAAALSLSISRLFQIVERESLA